MANTTKGTDSKTKRAALYAKGGKKLAEEVEQEEDEEFDFTSFGAREPETLEVEESYDPTSDVEFRDIFVEVGDPRMGKGLITKYFIKKNGELLKTVFHPYSFEKLKEENGGGVYIVEARDDRGKYLKQQTMVISAEGGSQQTSNEYALFKSEIDSLKASLEEKKGGELGLMEILAMQREAEDRARREAREAQKELQGNQNQLLQTVLTLMAGNSNKSETMVLELAKMTQSLVDKLNESQSRMFEKINDRFERVVENIKDEKGPKAPSAFELLKLQKDAEDQGFKRFQMLNELAEAKAQEKVDLIESTKDSGGGGEPESVTDTLIKTMLPTITNALAANGQPVAAAPARRSLPQGQRPLARARLNAGGGASQVQGSVGGAVKAQAAQAAVPAGGANRPKASDGLGLAKASFSGNTTTVEKVQETTEVKVEGVKKQILDQAIPVIVEHLTRDQNFELAASRTLEAVNKAHGIDGKTVLENFTREDVLTIVKGYNLPSATTPWFHKYYDSLTAKAGTA